MGLSNPRSLFGLHSVSPYSRTDGTFYGILKVLKSSNLSMSASNVELRGGSQKFPWAVETGEIKAEVDLKVAEYPDFLFTLFLGQAPTSVTAPAAGAVSAPANKQGTSIVSATGIASLAITTAADAKFAKFVIKAADTTHVDVYMSTDVDGARGTAASYQDDFLKITATPIALPGAGGTVAIPGIGVTITCGASAAALVAGDTATFELLPAFNKHTDVTVGSASSVYPEFGMIAMAQRTGDKRMFEVDIFRCKGAGLPMPFAPNAWNELDIKLGVFYDSTKDAVYKSRYIEET